jgi:hypothetical protein
LAGRCDDEGGCTALDVNEKDLQRLRAGRRARQRDTQQNCNDDSLHDSDSEGSFQTHA